MKQAKTGQREAGVAPTVSVICIFLNEERFIREAVTSVFHQDFDDWELILVDDGSHDSSRIWARETAARHARVSYLEHPGHVNRGMSASRNLGLAHCRGRLVAFIDADDVWRPHKLREQVALMDALPVVGMVAGRVNYWQSWAGGADRLVPTGHRVDAVVSPPEVVLRIYPLGHAGAPSPSDALIRRDVIASVGGFEEEFPGMFEDQVFFSKVFLTTTVFFSGRVWLDYRLHPDSCSAEAERAGRYTHYRRRYLDWLDENVQAVGQSNKNQIGRAINRERWKLDHPTFARRLNKLGRAFDRLRTGLSRLAEIRPRNSLLPSNLFAAQSGTAEPQADANGARLSEPWHTSTRQFE